MRILSSKEKDTSNTPPEPVLKSQKAVHGDVRNLKELIGREFHTVKNGIDPDEVSNFLESILGSTESALKRLEHFSALQKSTQTMELMMTEARLLSEHIKVQSEQEGQAEKGRIIAEGEKQAAEIVEEGKRQSLEMIEQTRSACMASIEETNAILSEAKRKLEQLLEQTRKSYGDTINDTNSVVLEAIVKAREMEEMAFQKAKEMAFMNTASMQKDIGSVVEETRNELNALFEQFSKLSPAGQVQPAATHSDNGSHETAPAAVEAQETTVAAVGDEPTVPGVEKAEEPVRAEFAPSPKKVNNNLYKGEVTLVIPQGVGQAWMQQLRQRLLNTPCVRIRMESGDDTGGTMMTLSISELIALPALLLDMPGVEDVTEGNNGQESGEPAVKPGRGAVLQPQRKTLTVLLNRNN